MTVTLHLRDMHAEYTDISVSVSGNPLPTLADVMLIARNDMILIVITETAVNRGALIGEACAPIVKELCAQLLLNIKNIFCVLRILQTSYPDVVVQDEYIFQDFHEDYSRAEYRYISRITLDLLEDMFSGKAKFFPQALKMDVFSRK